MTSQSIDKAAKEWAKPFLVNKSRRIRDFKAGADYVLSHPELMREVAVDFAKWRDNYIKSKGRIARSDDELFTLYLEQNISSGEQDKKNMKNEKVDRI